MTASKVGATGVKIFRANDAPGLVQSGVMSMNGITQDQRDGFKKIVAAGYTEGDEVKILTDMPGFSLAYAWLKQDYPLTLHSHDSDCLYYVIAGSLRLGTTDLGPRDSFFVPAGVPYTYRPGAEGVEVLEFRHATHFNMEVRSKGAFWKKAEQTCAALRERWMTAKRPSEAR